MTRRLCCCLFALGALLAGGASASAAVSTRLGSAPRRPTGTSVLGALPATTPLRVTIALVPSDAAALAAYAAAVTDPASADYHSYLSVSAFASRFGAPTSAINAVRSELSARGLGSPQLSANHLSLTTSASAGTVARALSTSFQRVSLPGGRSAYANTQAPSLPAAVAADVQGITGLDDLATPQPHHLLGSATRARASAAPRASAGASVCTTAASARSTASNTGSYTIDQIASAYGFGGLYSAGDTGAGVNAALYELEPNFPADISAFQQCYGTNASVSYRPVDGGAGSPSASNQDGIETSLDAENLIGLAPGINLTIYQGPDTGQGYLDTYEQIISQDSAKVISTSWGLCEPDQGRSIIAAENTLFEEAATQGQSVLAASGDEGAQDCDGDQGANDLATTTDDPASQPFVTGVGGTSLSTTSPRAETVWNNGSAAVLSGDGGAGGGGDSSAWTMPGYQSLAPASLNVVNAQSSSATCGAVGARCREVPDVSADADVNTPYLIYWDGNGQATDAGAWISVGGTSGAAPVWAALFALADADSACRAAIGFANPDLYGAAAAAYGSVFNDVTAGNNDLLGLSGSLYSAGAGYDQASGLGTPIATALVPALCAQAATLTVTNPGAQSSPVGVATTLQLRATESSAVAYAASGLPPGLALNAATGTISGTPTAIGSSNVTVTALDTHDRVTRMSFTWTITDRVALGSLAARAGQVGRATSLQLHGSDAAGRTVTYAASGLPSGLRLNAATGRIAGTPTRAGVFRVTALGEASGSTTGRSTFTWTVGAKPALSHVSLSGGALSLRLTAGRDAARLRTISLKLPAGWRVVSLRNGSRRLPYTERGSGGRQVVRLRSPSSAITLTLAAPGHARGRSVSVTVTDTAGLTNSLSARA